MEYTYLPISHKVIVEVILGNGKICYYDPENRQWEVLSLTLDDLMDQIQADYNLPSDRLRVSSVQGVKDHRDDSLGHLTSIYNLSWTTEGLKSA